MNVNVCAFVPGGSGYVSYASSVFTHNVLSITQNAAMATELTQKQTETFSLSPKVFFFSEMKFSVEKWEWQE